MDVEQPDFTQATMVNPEPQEATENKAPEPHPELYDEAEEEGYKIVQVRAGI